MAAAVNLVIFIEEGEGMIIKRNSSVFILMMIITIFIGVLEEDVSCFN